MILDLIIAFLALAITLYCLFGGADFGAGILSLFITQRGDENLSSAISPVWEANHIWLILAVTILFVGFPGIYSTVSIYLHIPVLLFLVGIILRGTAFNFMHYDAYQTKSTSAYRLVFEVSSIVTPFFLGITIGALMLGKIDANAPTFYAAYVTPWFNIFAMLHGLFLISLFAFLAAVFLIGEAQQVSTQKKYIRAAAITQLTTVGSGGLIFLSAWYFGVPMLQRFLSSEVALGCIGLSMVFLAGMWWALKWRSVWFSRMMAGGQTLAILLGWFWIWQPTVIKRASQADLTFANSAAPKSTLLHMLIALSVGACLILPGVYYLFKTFKFGDRPEA